MMSKEGKSYLQLEKSMNKGTNGIFRIISAIQSKNPF